MAINELIRAKDKQNIISEASLREIDRWILKYPADQSQSAIMAALRIVQEQNGGWLTNELIEAVADYLNMPRIAAYEVATFYSMYELKPVGKHKICVCTNVSCLLCGSENIVEHLKNKLGISFGQVTTDKMFSLKEVECLGACANAPVIQIGNTYHENLTAEKIDQILENME